jgi:hypothetical protein
MQTLILLLVTLAGSAALYLFMAPQLTQAQGQAHTAGITGRMLTDPDRWQGLIVLGVCVILGIGLLGLALLWVLGRTRRRIVASEHGLRIEDPQTGRHTTLDESREWLQDLLNTPPKT